MKNILITGGAGYIGSHTALELLKRDYLVTVVDNLSNSSEKSLKRVEQLSSKKIRFHNFDLRDHAKLDKLFNENEFQSVIHFAGLKAVGESVENPLMYYDNNLGSTLVLCKVMLDHDVRQFVFSSSATVYGNPDKIPITEDTSIHPINPYGHTKAMIEQIIKDLAATNAGWQISILRYFNPIGAHESGQIGEDPNGTPNNLLPIISQVAIGKLQKLLVYGDDYDTVDGTGVRDYIHVVDLASGHVAAIEHMPLPNTTAIYNLGTGKGTSVLQIIKAFEVASGKKIPYQISPRRPGDIPICYADVSKAANELDWHTSKSIEQACVDSWRWQSNNPNGY